MRLSHSGAVFFLGAVLITFAAAGARSESGLTGAPILNRPIGARSSGMGRAFTAVPGDAESVMYNPAGLAFVPGLRACVSYMNGFDWGNYGFAAVPVKVGGLVLTPAFLYFNSGKMELNLSDGTSGNVVAELDMVSMLSAAYKPLPEFAVGATVKRTTIELAETASASALHYDLGALYAMKSGLSLGAALLNNGQAVKFEEKGDPAPAAIRAGFSYKFEINPPNLLDRSADISYCDVVITSDWSRVVKEKGYYQSGLEMNMKMRNSIFLSLRAGYLFGRPEEGITFGVGIKSGRWDFGFGFETAKKLDSRRPVSLSYEF
ncbi:MAG: PorV/PorQ family protein [Elusimicrobiota bacterium]|nr:PorV/PorQ family protein [Elusimicrobiota bacterium]